MLEAFAASAAIGVATARTAASQRRRQAIAATEAERTRWARELHDETLQSLANLRLMLAAAQRSGRAELMAQAIAESVEQLESDIAGLRSLITDLRPAALDELGVHAAVEGLVERVQNRGIDVDASIDLGYEQGRKNDRLAPEIETTVYRIVQEALTNATKHGGAHRAVVEVSEDAGRVHASVRDDGVGFDLAQRTEGFGLMGMRERVELLDGTLNIESAPGQGTTITVDLPAWRQSELATAGEQASVRRRAR